MKYTHIIALLTLFFTSGCKEQETFPVASNNPCTDAGETAKHVFGRTGLAYYDTHQNLFSIQTPLPNTYDVVDVGIVCNMPEEVQHDIKEASADQKLVEVTFSGTYREVADARVGGPVGYTYYYLSLSSIRIERVYDPE